MHAEDAHGRRNLLAGDLGGIRSLGGDDGTLAEKPHGVAEVAPIHQPRTWHDVDVEVLLRHIHIANGE
ncbi:hypothetical protein [Nonomuraea aurantiaca]|uniref:hypothetical protein n=1 Tax=Nonomuraea aurantiaca TaxID=2878562 RepID=UPI001CD94E06|nr:hypothetical protein [Nonomuraea aurantiaca]MCA2230157.1 hypothetical protein [Nonomuraea aurantiaca]